MGSINHGNSPEKGTGTSSNGQDAISLSSQQLPKIPQNVREPSHLSFLKNQAKDVLLQYIPNRIDRGPDGGSGTLLNEKGFARLAEIFEDEIFDDLLNENNPDYYVQDDKDVEYKDSFAGIIDTEDPSDDWQNNVDSDSALSKEEDYSRNSKFQHIEAMLLSAAALSDGTHLLFVAFYDNKIESLMVPSVGTNGYDFLSPAALSRNELIGIVVKIIPDFGFFEAESSELYLSPIVFELELAAISEGELTPWADYSLKTLPIWNGTHPSQFKIIRAKLIDQGSAVEAFIASEDKLPPEQNEVEDPKTTENKSSGRVWCKFGIGEDGIPAILSNVYFPSSIDEIKNTLVYNIGADVDLPEQVKAHALAPPQCELIEDFKLAELGLPEFSEIDYTPLVQIDHYFHSQGFERLNKQENQEQSKHETLILRLALSLLNNQFALKLGESEITCFLYKHEASQNYIVGFQTNLLKDPYENAGDLLFIRVSLSPTEPDNYDVLLNFYGIAMQDYDYLSSLLRLTEDSAQESILCPMILAMLPSKEIPDSELEQEDNAISFSIGFPSSDYSDREISSKVSILVSNTIDKSEFLVDITRNKDGGIIVFESNVPNTGAEVAGALLEESCISA